MTKQISVKKATYKTQNFYFLLESLLITKALLIAVGTYCYDKISDKILSKIKTFIAISRQKVMNSEMSNKVEDIDIKNQTYYIFNDIIDRKIFDPNNIKIQKKNIKKYSYLLYSICDDQRFELHKS